MTSAVSAFTPANWGQNNAFFVCASLLLHFARFSVKGSSVVSAHGSGKALSRLSYFTPNKKTNSPSAAGCGDIGSATLIRVCGAMSRGVSPG